jgi:DNA invertase Pin-like site-specific DNA recombinase
MSTPQKRAIGIVRVSQVGGREADAFHSPATQRARIEAACRVNDWHLVDVCEEINVSGGKPLAKRKGLLAAIEAVEAGRAHVLVIAYFDRLVRSIKVQTEVVERVEAAGGDIFTVDFGQITNGSAVQKLTSHFMGAVNEYVRTQGKERIAEAQTIAISKGHWPVILIPGLRRQEEGAIELDPATSSAVGDAFRLRAGGATVNAVREHLRHHGITRSFHGTTSLLRSRQAIGEIKFGAHRCTVPALVDAGTWRDVQKMIVPRGPKPKSERLLARLGVLRCGTCNAKMVVATANNSRYYVYRCPPVGDCAQHMSISATIVEDVVVAWVKQELAGLTGAASGASGVVEATVELERAQAALDAAMRSFADAGLMGEPVAVDTLARLRAARDEAKDRHADAVDADESLSVAVTVGDWDVMTLAERRDLIRAVVGRVLVHPGRGASRIEVIPK